MSKKKPWLFKVFQLFRPHSGLVLLAALAGTARYLIPLIVPWSVKVIIDDILTQPSADAYARLHNIVLGLLGLFLLWSLLSYVRAYLVGLVGNRIVFDLRHRLYSHIQKMSMDFFEKRKVGAVVSRLTSDIKMVQQLVGYGVISVLMDSGSIVVISALMFLLDWRLALVSIALVPAYMFMSRYFARKLRRTGHEVQGSMEKLSGNLHEKFSGISVIKSFSREKLEEKYFLNDADSHFNAAMKSVKYQSLGIALTGFFSSTAPIIVLWFCALDALQGTLSLGALVAFYAYVGLLYVPVARLIELYVVIGGSLASLDRVFEVLDDKPKVRDHSRARHLPTMRGKIRFKNVSFAYSPDSMMLNDVDFEIQPGEKVALLGASGAGKSTLVKLILRFYDVNLGAVLIDDVDIRDLALSTLRSQIALVGQEPTLFSGTIRENILYGRVGATWEEALHASKVVGAHGFIEKLPRAYDTPVGERGLMLSAGEKQKIAIARAFLKDVPILILDEPLSALDETSAKDIAASLQTLKEGRTVITISHRMTPFEEFDRIFLISESQVSEVPDANLAYHKSHKKPHFIV